MVEISVWSGALSRLQGARGSTWKELCEKLRRRMGEWFARAIYASGDESGEMEWGRGGGLSGGGRTSRVRRRVIQDSCETSRDTGLLGQLLNLPTREFTQPMFISSFPSLFVLSKNL